MNPEIPARSPGAARTPLRRLEGSDGNGRDGARRGTGRPVLVSVPAPDPRVGGDQKGEASNARGERTRRRIVETVIRLLEEQEFAPTAKEVALRAGVSVRLIFHHFEDMDALYRAVAATQIERHWRPLRSVPSDLPFAERIDRTAAQRAKLFDAISGVRRTAVSLALRNADVSRGLATSNMLLRARLEETFSPELAAAGPARGDLLASIEVAGSWETWERLRRGQGLSKAAARRVLVRTLHALLDA